MRKTVNIDDDLKAEIDRLRGKRGVSMKEVLNDALRCGLREIEAHPRSPKSFRTKDMLNRTKAR